MLRIQELTIEKLRYNGEIKSHVGISVILYHLFKITIDAIGKKDCTREKYRN